MNKFSNIYKKIDVMHHIISKFLDTHINKGSTTGFETLMPLFFMHDEERHFSFETLLILLNFMVLCKSFNYIE